MRPVRFGCALAVLCPLLLHAPPVAGQSGVLLQLESGSPPGDRMVVDSAGGLLVRGTVNFGTIPATGAGARLMWYPRRAAFRAGGVHGAQWNDANVGNYSTATGFNTTASGLGATAMGYFATAAGSFSTAIGYYTATDGSSSVAMGYETTASASLTTALGTRARAAHAGSFVWGSSGPGGGLPSDTIVSTATGQFSIRAMGGIRMFTNVGMTSGVTMSAGASTWNAVSDRARKEHFAEVDGEDLLARLRSVPVTSWNYIAEGAHVRHIGPMAQDWHAAFGLNDDPLTINQGDFDGVNLAAIQALLARTDALAEENAGLRGENAELRLRLERLEALVTGAALPAVP
jgi:trimeric autotransporter adhesin